MKMKQFRSILAVATVATSITASSLPSQAFTWDDLWQSVKRGYENAPSSNSSQPQSNSNSETQQTGGFNNDTPQPETAPQQNSYSAPSSPTPPLRRVIFRRLQVSCVKASGYDPSGIGRDNAESIVSVGQHRSAMLKSLSQNN